jgi:hypothetical protein
MQPDDNRWLGFSAVLFVLFLFIVFTTDWKKAYKEEPEVFSISDKIFWHQEATKPITTFSPCVLRADEVSLHLHGYCSQGSN